MRRASIVAALLAFFASVAPLRAGVVVVDAANGPGTDFTTLTAALAAASDGDILLIRSGVYVGTHDVKTSVTLIADEGAVVRLENSITPAAGGILRSGAVTGAIIARIVIRGLDLAHSPTPQSLFTGADFALQLRGKYAPLTEAFIDECSVDDVAFEAAMVTGFARVVITKGRFVGGDSTPLFDSVGAIIGHSDGGHGLYLPLNGGVVPTIDLFATTARGGRGRPASTFEPTYADIGGPGVRFASGGATFGPFAVSGCSITGGQGGAGFAGPTGCVAAANGAFGIGSLLPVNGYLIGCTVAGGAPGVAAAGCPSTTQSGPAMYNGFGGSYATIAANPGVALAPRALREGQASSLGVGGTPGDTAVLVLGLQTTRVFATGIAGSLVVDPAVIFAVGTIGANGEAVVPGAPVPELGPGIEALPIYFQAFTQSPSGQVTAGAPTVTLLLDSQF